MKTKTDGVGSNRETRVLSCDNCGLQAGDSLEDIKMRGGTWDTFDNIAAPDVICAKCVNGDTPKERVLSYMDILWKQKSSKQRNRYDGFADFVKKRARFGVIKGFYTFKTGLEKKL